MNLRQAEGEGIIQDDVKEIAACSSIPAGLMTFRGIGRCMCGTPVLLHVETVCRNGSPSLLRVEVGGAHCPACRVALTPETVGYAGIFSQGWPSLPATSVSIADVHHALALPKSESRR